MEVPDSFPGHKDYPCRFKIQCVQWYRNYCLRACMFQLPFVRFVRAANVFLDKDNNGHQNVNFVDL